MLIVIIASFNTSLLIFKVLSLHVTTWTSKLQLLLIFPVEPQDPCERPMLVLH